MLASGTSTEHGARQPLPAGGGHSIVDDCSRLPCSEIHDDERAATVTAFTERALDFFLDRGVVAERLMTDNAFACTEFR